MSDGTRTFRSDPLRSLHRVAEDLQAVGAIDEATTAVGQRLPDAR